MDFSTLRPAAQTSTAIREALERAQAMNATVLEHVSTAKAHRDGMLLDGDARQLVSAEKALTEARGDEERLEAIVTELTSRLAATVKAEAFAGVRDSLKAAADATNARRIWWEANGQQLKDMLREASTLHIAQSDASEEARRKQLRLVDYDDHAHLFAAIREEVPASQDVDEATWRTFEKLADAWSWYVMFPETDADRKAA